MIGLINRGNLPDVVLAEFENLVARIREIFLKEHNEDGTHLTIPASLSFVPVGGMMMWTTATAPSGWVLARGQQLSRLTYGGLFAVIGTTYGAGNGTTTFNVPDLQGKFPLGKASAGTGSTLAGTGGSLDHTHTEGAHTHSFSATTSSNGNHNHDVNIQSSNASGSQAAASAGAGDATTFGHSHDVDGSTTSDGSHTHTVSGTSGSGGGGSTGTGNPAFLSLNYIIYTGVA